MALVHTESHDILQPQLPYAHEVVDTSVLPALIDGDRRITLHRMVRLISEELALPSDYTDRWDLEQAEPEAIEKGLYIPTNDKRVRDAEQLYEGVVFPPEEFKVIARNPRDLVKHVKATTREANETKPNRDEADQTVGRSAAHALESKLTSLEKYRKKMETKRLSLLSLHKDIRSAGWIAHYKAKNLDQKRRETDEAIHETAEVASINLNLGTVAIDGLHRAIRFNLYGHPNEMRNWGRYILMVGTHTRKKINASMVSTEACQQEFNRYARYLPHHD